MVVPSSRRRRILIIDDDAAQFRCVRDLMSEFRTEQFDLDWSSTFGDGLIALLSGKYAACLLDYQLGQQTGIDLLKQANIAECRTPIILLTGWMSDDIDLDAMNAGALDYLVKSELTARSLERALRYVLKMSASMEALRNLATHDDVTGLLNRRAMDRILLEEWQRAARFHRDFAVTLVDLDHFKQVNDTHGHLIGDAVLKHVASLLEGQIRSVDRVARYGGEEFGIIQIETNLQGALLSSERLRILLNEIPFVHPTKNITIPITLSAGVASFPAHGETVEATLSAADQALYLAKARGRNRVVSADELTVAKV